MGKANRKDPICFSKYLYQARNLVERFFNKIKHFRRIATRDDKLAENILAAAKLCLLRRKAIAVHRRFCRAAYGWNGMVGLRMKP